MISADCLRASPRRTNARLGTLDALAVNDCEGVRVSGDEEDGAGIGWSDRGSRLLLVLTRSRGGLR